MTEFVQGLIMFDVGGLRPLVFGSFANRKTIHLDQFVEGLEGSTDVRLICFESLGQPF